MLPKSICFDKSYKAKVALSILAELNLMSDGKSTLFDAPCLKNYTDCELSYLHKVLMVCTWYRKHGFKHTDFLTRVKVLSNGFMHLNRRIILVRHTENTGFLGFDDFVCVRSLNDYVNECLNEGFTLEFFPPCSDVPDNK